MKAKSEAEEALELDSEFESDVIARALQDTNYLRDAAPVLDGKNLSSPQRAWLWSATKDSWSRFAEKPTLGSLKKKAERDFPDDKKRLPYLKELKSLYTREVASPFVALDELRRFVRYSVIHDSMTEAAKALGKFDVDEADRLLREATKESLRPRLWEVSSWAAGFDERQARRRARKDDPTVSRRAPTGLKVLDKALSGGLSAEEFGSVLATTNKGKSIALVNFGYASLMAGLRVCHFTFEMSVAQVDTRYDSRFLREKYDRLRDYDLTPEELRKVQARFARHSELIGNLRVVGMPMQAATPLMMESALDEAMNDLGGCDLIIADSVDHLVPERRNKDVRLDHSEVYWSFKSLLQRRKMAGWTSTHAGREYAAKIATTEASAESYDKARIVDVQVSLNTPESTRRRTSDDSDEEDDEERDSSPPLRGFLAKNRDGRAHFEFPIGTDLSRMLMFDGEEDVD